jgi:hypothetical protein
VVLKARLDVLEEDPDSRPIRALREKVRVSARTRALLATRKRPGHSAPVGAYHKWLGTHWALAHLADLGYPTGDASLEPLAQQALDVWLQPAYFREFDASTEAEATRRHDAVPCVAGRYRRCASQQGNALFYCMALGLAQDRCDQLAERLMHWQWPDGGWNCDRNPGADTSSFGETLTPMIGLFTYGAIRRRSVAMEAARRAGEVFLRRRLYKRISDGRVIHWEFAELHYPLYWHYDFLGGLKGLGRMARLNDPRCRDALDLLESKALPHGGWRAERRFYDLPGERPRRGTDRVRWGRLGRGTMNEWVTADALSVLRKAGRSSPGV